MVGAVFKRTHICISIVNALHATICISYTHIETIQAIHENTFSIDTLKVLFMVFQKPFGS